MKAEQMECKSGITAVDLVTPEDSTKRVTRRLDDDFWNEGDDAFDGPLAESERQLPAKHSSSVSRDSYFSASGSVSKSPLLPESRAAAVDGIKQMPAHPLMFDISTKRKPLISSTTSSKSLIPAAFAETTPSVASVRDARLFGISGEWGTAPRSPSIASLGSGIGVRSAMPHSMAPSLAQSMLSGAGMSHTQMAAMNPLAAGLPMASQMPASGGFYGGHLSFGGSQMGGQMPMSHVGGGGMYGGGLPMGSSMAQPMAGASMTGAPMDAHSAYFGNANSYGAMQGGVRGGGGDMSAFGGAALDQTHYAGSGMPMAGGQMYHPMYCGSTGAPPSIGGGMGHPMAAAMNPMAGGHPFGGGGLSDARAGFHPSLMAWPTSSYGAAAAGRKSHGFGPMQRDFSSATRSESGSYGHGHSHGHGYGSGRRGARGGGRSGAPMASPLSEYGADSGGDMMDKRRRKGKRGGRRRRRRGGRRHKQRSPMSASVSGGSVDRRMGPSLVDPLTMKMGAVLLPTDVSAAGSRRGDSRRSADGSSLGPKRRILDETIYTINGERNTKAFFLDKIRREGADVFDCRLLHSMRCTLDDLIAARIVVQLATHKYGSRYLQKCLEHPFTTVEQLAEACDALLPRGTLLCQDAVGYFVIQRLLEVTCERADDLPTTPPVIIKKKIKKEKKSSDEKCDKDEIKADSQTESANEEEEEEELRSSVEAALCLSEDFFSHDYGRSELLKDPFIMEKRLTAKRCKKLQELGERVLRSVFLGKVRTLAQTEYSCRLVQRVLRYEHYLEIKLHILSEIQSLEVLDDYIRNPFGNHVVQKCIEKIPNQHLDELCVNVTPRIYMYSTHIYGCRVVQRLLSHCNETQTAPMYNVIIATVDKLARNQFGNYVVQHVLNICAPADGYVNRIAVAMSKSMRSLACHKFASNVVERCLRLANGRDKQTLISSVLFADASRFYHGYGDAVSVPRKSKQIAPDSSSSHSDSNELDEEHSVCGGEEVEEVKAQHSSDKGSDKQLEEEDFDDDSGRDSDRELDRDYQREIERSSRQLLKGGGDDSILSAVGKGGVSKFARYPLRPPIAGRDSVLFKLITDAYGNYVLQTLFDVMDLSQKRRLVSDIQACVPRTDLLKLSWGKHILNKIERVESHREELEDVVEDVGGHIEINQRVRRWHSTTSSMPIERRPW